MKSEVAKVLLGNLIDRVTTEEDGTKKIQGVLTDSELEALKIAYSVLEEHQNSSSINELAESTETSVSENLSSENNEFNLNFDSLSLPNPTENIRLCLDFGTAMSKATIVRDDVDNEEEKIDVLRLGVPSDQEEISEEMLISSVFIDEMGKMWFGQMAVNRSMLNNPIGQRQRLDNIKRWLSEGGQDEFLDSRFNPTNEKITYEDIILAYLTFMTWTVNICLEELNYPANLQRRFAIPCLTGERKREVLPRMKSFVGKAQVLADTFGNALVDGLPISVYMAAVRSLNQHKNLNYPYVAEDLTEPLGVAGSIMSWKNNVNSLVMVIDIGAGTSDLSLYRLFSDSRGDRHLAHEVKDTSRVLTEAGNYLDKILIELIIKKSGVTSDDSMWANVRGALELSIRDYKESLFNDESIFISLMDRFDVEVSLAEFLELDAVQKFGEDLRNKVKEILESIDPSWIRWITAHPARKLVVALTGGGSELPMVQSLAEGSINVNGIDIPVERSMKFPRWLRELDENLESIYPRVAVSLGGARKRLINDEGPLKITGGDVTETPKIGGFYIQGS